MIRKRLNIIFIILLCVFTISLKSQDKFRFRNSIWADSLMKTMTLEEKIAQLFMIDIYSNKGKNYEQQLLQRINKYNFGGVIFMRGDLKNQVKLTNLIQEKSKYPLLVGMDAEWGLAMRLKDVKSFPKAMTLGAIKDNSLIYELGTQVAKDCKRIGVHINFAPVLDINNNINNPVINTRSFGENKEVVANKAFYYAMGMQDNGLIVTGKHFPGHGNTVVDSHKAAPVIGNSLEEIRNTELYPFKQLIDKGITGMMVGHLNVPALDSIAKVATVSNKIITGVLKTELGFEGIVFSDALNMHAVSKLFKPGRLEVESLKAGCDMLMFSENVPQAIIEIKKALENQELSIDDINEKCLKILNAKHLCNLHELEPVEIHNVKQDVNTIHSEILNYKLAKASITVVQNKKKLLPIKDLTQTIACLNIGTKKSVFQKIISKYTKIKHFNVKSVSETSKLISKLKKYDIVIVNNLKVNNSMKRNYGFSSEFFRLVSNLKVVCKKVILPVFANPYSLSKYKFLDELDAVIVSYNKKDITQSLTAQAILGGIKTNGKLPVSINENFKQGQGKKTKKIRIGYGMPELVNIDSKDYESIDSIIKKGIKDKAFPGCQVLVARKGMVIYDKSFGYQTYNKKRRVNSNTLYDIASVTKIVSAIPCLMRLYDLDSIDINKKVSDYLPRFLSTNKKEITLKQILTHSAGLPPIVSFLSKLQPLKKYFTNKKTAYNMQVAKNLFFNKKFYEFTDSLLIHSNLIDSTYLYSDVGFYFLKEIIEKQSGLKIDEFLFREFYRKLGLNTTMYNPIGKCSVNNIAPTENDKKFRKQLIKGYVHDEGAAIYGGVGAHAGIFSTSNDLVKLLQMYLNGGKYGDYKYIKKTTLNTFTTSKVLYNFNRRALGFDKPEIDSDKEGPTCKEATFLSYGHTGFTGTMVWVDPKYELIYIFLSNRIYPKVNNHKLIEDNIRTKIQSILYKSIKEKNKLKIFPAIKNLF